ncbi:MAG TPA: MarR family transcriptional regulator [Methanoregula sp.]|nr:MarR family transcriptional regulator [Methanoregula sp.]
MHPGEHVHIISAGETIHTAFAAMLRELPGITRTYVVADGGTYGISQNPQIEKDRAATRHAVESVKEIAVSLDIPFARETVFCPVLSSARTVLTKIRRENKRARFTFDLSGGSRDLCMALFALAPWLGGDVWSSFDGKMPQQVPVPDRDIRAMMVNVNYQTILAVLLRNRPVPANPDVPFVPRQYLFQQVWPYYIRQRAKKPVEGAPVVAGKRGLKPANDLSQATFSWFMATLTGAGLAGEVRDRRSRRETAYRITADGEMAFRFFADPATNSIVKMMLDGS